jgi:hypothetical protein
MSRKSTAPSVEEASPSAPRARAGRRVAASAAKPEVKVRTKTKPAEPADESPSNAIDPELRHRLISEAAHALYAERGYVDGFHFEDWLTAETEVDKALLNRGDAKKPQ